jgi:hypothetical protein
MNFTKKYVPFSFSRTTFHERRCCMTYTFGGAEILPALATKHRPRIRPLLPILPLCSRR